MIYRIKINNKDSIIKQYSEKTIDIKDNLYFDNKYSSISYLYAYNDENNLLHELYTDSIIESYDIIECIDLDLFIKNDMFLKNIKLNNGLSNLLGYNRNNNIITIKTILDEPVDISFEMYNELCNLLNIKNEFISYKHYYEKMLLKYEYIKLIISFRNKMSNINATNIDDTNKFINEYNKLIEIIKNKDLELDKKYKKSKHLIK